MKVGFFSNQLDNRGTGNALYNYAHYNEEILGNESVIFTRPEGNHDDAATKRFVERFEALWGINALDAGSKLIGLKDLDALYHIKSGFDDGFRPTTDIPYLVHSVFDNEPHGTIYATISPWMGERFNLPYVPHIVEVADTQEDLRDELGIPKDAVVFGRYGGADSFDIPFVHSAFTQFVGWHEDVYGIFMNTDKFVEHSRIIHLPSTVDPVRKRQFINTCDAMLHARSRGETFGIAVGEFSIVGKPIITFADSHERAHLQELGNFALTYDGYEEVQEQLKKVHNGPLVSWGYGQYTPENVMKKFDEVFLSCVK